MMRATIKTRGPLITVNIHTLLLTIIITNLTITISSSSQVST